MLNSLKLVMRDVAILIFVFFVEDFLHQVIMAFVSLAMRHSLSPQITSDLKIILQKKLKPYRFKMLKPGQFSSKTFYIYMKTNLKEDFGQLSNIINQYCNRVFPA